MNGEQEAGETGVTNGRQAADGVSRQKKNMNQCGERRKTVHRGDKAMVKCEREERDT
jgi:hypothetical protein